MACKPVLDGTAELLAGYRTLQQQEAKYTAKALREMPDGVAVWYRYLTLYDRAHRGEHESPSWVHIHQTYGPRRQSRHQVERTLTGDGPVVGARVNVRSS